MEQKEISVIIPVLNGMPYFESCLNSITTANYKKLDIIVIADPTSTDDTVSFAKKAALQDKRIRCYESHMPIQHNRQLGISHAKGEYLCFVDADDLIDRNHFKILSNLLESRPDAILSKSKTDSFENDNPSFKSAEITCKAKNMTVRKFRLRLLSNKQPASQGLHTYMFKTKFLKNNNIHFPDYRYYEDLGFLIRLLEKSGTEKSLVCYTNTVTYHLRNHQSSYSRAPKANKTFSVFEALDAMRSSLDDKDRRQFDLFAKIHLAGYYLMLQKQSAEPSEKAFVKERFSKTHINLFDLLHQNPKKIVLFYLAKAKLLMSKDK